MTLLEEGNIDVCEMYDDNKRLHIHIIVDIMKPYRMPPYNSYDFISHIFPQARGVYFYDRFFYIGQNLAGRPP